MMKMLMMLGLVLIANPCRAEEVLTDVQIDENEIVVATDVAETDVAPVVAQRLSCDEIQAKITELGEAEQTQDVQNQITKFKADYRRSCTRVAGARRTSVAGRVIIENPVPGGTDVAEVFEPEEKKSEDVVTDVDADSTELTLEQELANLDAGLCADGMAPNKYGCCKDEVFKDLGNTVFACCPKAGGDCFPPIK